MSEPSSVHQQSKHPVYAELYDSDDFRQLRHRYGRFAFPWTIAFFVWYMLYVLMSNWATGFMNTQIVGHINVALVFGLLQFLSTFAIAWLYQRHARLHLDPLSRALKARYDEEINR